MVTLSRYGYKAKPGLFAYDPPPGCERRRTPFGQGIALSAAQERARTVAAFARALSQSWGRNVELSQAEAILNTIGALGRGWNPQWRLHGRTDRKAVQS